MVKTITKIGNSNGIIFDATLMDMAHLKTGDQVNVTLHDGNLILTPLNPRPSPEKIKATIRQTVKDYQKTLKKLA
ncbi:MAG TPA: AbrB family transcriptional regulator [Verrucomicrobiae bacterium]